MWAGFGVPMVTANAIRRNYKYIVGVTLAVVGCYLYLFFHDRTAPGVPELNDDQVTEAKGERVRP